MSEIFDNPAIKGEINKGRRKDFWRDVERSVLLIYLKKFDNKWSKLSDDDVVDISVSLRESIKGNPSLVRVLKDIYPNWDDETLLVDISAETEVSQFFDDGKPILYRTIILDFGSSITKELEVYYDENGKRIVDN